MSSGGRKRDTIWIKYFELPNVPGKTGKKVKCKRCGKIFQGLVDRMKKHSEDCVEDSAKLKAITNKNGTEPDYNNDTVSTAAHNQNTSETHDKTIEVCQVPNTLKMISSAPSTSQVGSTHKKRADRTMDSYVTKTTSTEKNRLDELCAKFIYSTNSAFQLVENRYFVEFCAAMRPGYSPPTRKSIGEPLLNNMYETLSASCRDELDGQVVNLSIDGWSNIRNEPIVCATITKDSGKVYLVNTLNTAGSSHTSEYLLKIVQETIKQTTEKFSCTVGSFVTDNAANMKRMRFLSNEQDEDLFCYACSAHFMNILALDITKGSNRSVIDETVKVSKYFRNHHLPKAWYDAAGGKALVVPLDVRWSSYCYALKSYIENWPILAKVSEEFRDNPAFDKTIGKLQFLFTVRNFHVLFYLPHIMYMEDIGFGSFFEKIEILSKCIKIVFTKFLGQSKQKKKIS